MSRPTSAADFGTRLPDVCTPVPGPASRALAERLAGVESRNVTFLGPDFPVFWERAAGANVRDADGNVFLDLTGAFGVAAAGHAHPRIVAAIREQAGELVHGMGDVHPPRRKVELLERLAALTPWPETRGFLAGSGSEAVEAALKTALLATGRPGIVAFRGGYHGLTLGSLSATAREDFRGPFRERLFQGVRFTPFPRGGSDRAVALAALASALDELEAAGTPAGCILVEVIQGRGGVRVAPDGFFREVAERARARGALLVVDEIFTGFGRTGTLFACEEEGVVPDLLCVGKALGGGLPLSALLGSREVMDAWPVTTGESLHTSTFLGHPLACASALAFLDVLEEERLTERAGKMGTDALETLRSALDGAPGVREVRGRGLFIGIELEGAGSGVRVALELLRRGVMALPAGDEGEVLELSPPLVITRSQLDFGLGAIGEVIRSGG